MHARLERGTQRALGPFFRALTEDVVRRIEKAGTVAVQPEQVFEPSQWRDPFNVTMRPRWNAALLSGIGFEREWIGSGNYAQAAASAIYVEPTPEQVRQLREYLRARESGVWSRIGVSTHDRLRRALQRGLKEGLDLDEMTELVNNVLKRFSTAAARRIARTETTGAIGFGGQSERDEAGIEFKEWVSRIDSRTRTYETGPADHLVANGQVVENAGTFVVSGERLLFPGDPNGSAANIINCRCSAVASMGKRKRKRRR